MKSVSLIAALATLVAFVSTASGQAPEKLALTGGRIIPVVGPEIENGTILIEHGVITAIGTEVQIPYDAMEVDVTGKVLFPGMIDPDSSSGLDRANEAIPVVPFLDVYDAIDPSRVYFEDALRDGVTTVHVMQGANCVISGLSRVVRPIGLSINEMTVRPELALKVVTSPRSGSDRMEQMAILREAFLKLDDDLDQLALRKYEDMLKKENRTLDVSLDEARTRGRELITDADYNDQMFNLVRLRRGDLAAWFHAGSATDVRPALAVAEAQGLLDRTVLILGTESHRAMAELKEAGRPVVLNPSLYHRQRDPLSGQLEEVFVPKKIYEAGLIFALQPNPSASMAERYLNYQAAVCVRNGIPRDVALKSITLYPAQILGMGDQLGSLEVGKTANIVVFNGDPLDFSSWVDLVYIDGILAYDRQRDHRLQELLRMQQRGSNQGDQSGTDDNTNQGAERNG